MRKNIIQSKTEPNKNDIWLSEEGLKKYGKNGWEPLGGGDTEVSSGGSGPVTIEINIGDEGFESATLTDQQIEACKNSNIKLKLNFIDYVTILVPYYYEINNETILIYIRMLNQSYVVADVSLEVDINNKTIYYKG